MSDDYTEVTGLKPVSISNEGTSVRLIFRSDSGDIKLHVPRPHLEDLIQMLLELSDAATVNAGLQPETQQEIPQQMNAPATVRIDSAVLGVRENSVLIRSGPYDQPVQVNIYGDAFKALKDHLTRGA